MHLSNDHLARIHDGLWRVDDNRVPVHERQCGRCSKQSVQTDSVILSSHARDIENALADIPRKFVVGGRRPDQILEITPGGNTYARTVGGPDFILDHSTNRRRPVVLNDTGQWIRLAQALENIHIIKPIYANDLPMATRDIQIFERMLALSDKALCIAPTSRRNMEWIVELAATAVGGTDRLRECPPGLLHDIR